MLFNTKHFDSVFPLRELPDVSFISANEILCHLSLNAKTFVINKAEKIENALWIMALNVELLLSHAFSAIQHIVLFISVYPPFKKLYLGSVFWQMKTAVIHVFVFVNS